MHIFFRNNQNLGSYYFTGSADDPVAKNIIKDLKFNFPMALDRDNVGWGDSGDMSGNVTIGANHHLLAHTTAARKQGDLERLKTFLRCTIYNFLGQ